MICFVSDSKKDLEKELKGNWKEVEVPKRPKRPLEENDVDNASLAKKRKERKDTAKVQKTATVVTANQMARQIFHERHTNVNHGHYSETQRQQHLQDIKKLTK